MNVSDYAAQWDEEILSMKKPATIASMRCHIRKINDYFGKTPIQNLDERAIQRNIAMVSKELSPRGTQNYWITFRLILARAQKEGLIRQIPEPVLPKGTTKPQLGFTVDEMRALSRQNLLWFVFSETGLRAGELFGLQNSDVNLTEKTLTVNRSVYGGQTQDPKSANAFRTLSLSSRLTEALREFITGDPGMFLFRRRNGSPYRQPQILQELHEDIRKLTRCPMSGFHAFRRGNATVLSRMGMPIKTISYRQGRATGDLTVDVYIQYSHGQDREFADRLGEMLV